MPGTIFLLTKGSNWRHLSFPCDQNIRDLTNTCHLHPLRSEWELNTLEKPQHVQDYHKHLLTKLYILFAFISACVVAKSPNAPNNSPSVEGIITQGNPLEVWPFLPLNVLLHLESIHPLWNIYSKFFTEGVLILSGLAHWTFSYRVSTLYTLWGRFNQQVAQRVCGFQIELLNKIINLKFTLSLMHTQRVGGIPGVALPLGPALLQGLEIHSAQKKIMDGRKKKTKQKNNKTKILRKKIMGPQNADFGP